VRLAGEVAGLALYLSFDEASDVTGSTYFIGGMLRQAPKLLRSQNNERSR